MPPKAEDLEATGLSLDESKRDFAGRGNADLMAHAGKVRMDEAQMWGTGIIQDFRNTVAKHWWTEMTNFNQKTIAVTLLLFISVIAPTLTFGAVYGKVTENRIGTVETILATSWIGCVYALIGGMPLVSPSCCWLAASYCLLATGNLVCLFLQFVRHGILNIIISCSCPFSASFNVPTNSVSLAPLVQSWLSPVLSSACPTAWMFPF